MRKFLLKEYETAGRICLVCFLRGRRFRDCSRGKFCIFRVVNVFIPKLMPEKRFKATKKRFNKHWFLKITSQRRYEKHRTCFGSTQPPFFSLTKNFKVEVIPAIILVCWCPQTQLVFKFLKSFFFFSFLSENPSSAHLFWNRTKPASHRRRRPRGRARGLRRAPTRSHGAKTECVLRSFSGFTVRCLSSAVRNTRYVKPQGSRHQSWAQRALVWGSALARQMGLDLWLCSSEPGLYFKSQQ